MSARIGTHEIRNPVDPDIRIPNRGLDLPAHRSALGPRVSSVAVTAGVLLVTNFGGSGCRSAVRRTIGDPSKPKHSEIDLDLKRFIERCWTQQLHKPGKPVEQRQGNLWWLT